MIQRKLMNSKEAQKIQYVINVLNREEQEIELLGEIEDNYSYWYKLGKAARLLAEIVEDARGK